MSDATALAALIRDGATSAAEVMEATLAACAERAELGAVVHLDREMARAGAAAADAAAIGARGPFHGIPFLGKDLGGTLKGLPTGAGSAAMRAKAERPDADDDLIAGLRATGLIPFGMSATPPFGPALSSEPEGLPPCRNPWDPALTAGGSSGGAASAVASGIVAIAHATDAAGSIRVPAACCGLTGLKPSRGAVPLGPDFSNYLIGIAAGLVLARSVRDVETAFRAVEKPLVTRGLPETPRVGFSIPDGCEAAQEAAIRSMAEALSDAGCTVTKVASPDALGAEAHRIAWAVIGISLAEWLEALEIGDDEVPPMAKALAREARAMPATALFALTREMARLSFEAEALFNGIDALLMPVLSRPPVPVGTFDLSGTETAAHRAGMAAFAPNVALANVAGLPALALPFGVADGVPVGGQLVGPLGSDAALLALGAMIEARAPDLPFPYSIAGMPG